jgi:hypothetical protein
MQRIHAAPLFAAVLLAGCPGLFKADGETDSDSDGSTSTSTTGLPTTLPDLTTTGFMLECSPGPRRCAPGGAGVQECKPTGLAWEDLACSENEECIEDASKGTAECIGPCEKITNPTSIGCEFLAIRMNSFNTLPDDKDALIVGNTDATRTAMVQLFFTPNNSLTEEALVDPVMLPPGESHIFDISNEPLKGYTNFRTGGVYRVETDIPVTAYLHSTLVNKASNDASMLLPTPTLRQDYVIASYPGFTDPIKPDETNGRPSYFNIIALEDGTNVEWVAPADTAAQGVLIPAVPAGETGSVRLNRFDVLQVGSSSTTNMDFATHDLSGTVVNADKPIWVMGATECAFVPNNMGFCNHLQEQMIPLEYWGKKYVGPHSPVRNEEKHYWRVYGGKDGVVVTVESNDPSYKPQPITLVKRGDYKELEVPHGVSLIFTATGPILPVQYLAGYIAAGETSGDPAMYQMIAVEQWLSRYVFVTGVNYDLNYAQVIRKKGAADVTINGEPVTGWYFINGTGADNQWEVADYQLADGDEARSYVAESADEFNIIVVGYKTALPTSAYSYPGGMSLQKIYDP